MPRIGFGLVIAVGAAMLLAIAAVPPAEGGKEDWNMLFNGKDTAAYDPVELRRTVNELTRSPFLSVAS